jgi:hypothetical protein
MEAGEDGGRAPDQYQVTLHADSLADLASDGSDIAAELARYVTSLAQEAGWTMRRPASVTLHVGAVTGRRSLEVSASHSPEPVGSTQVYQRGGGEETLHVLRAIDAYLIVQGKRHVPLDRVSMTIGRRNDNDIVLDDSAVSRYHAQLRWRFGRFVIYDLGSRAGTLVNGERVSESVLHPGDVILMGAVPLIYGEGLAGETRPRRAPSSDDEPGHTLTYRPDKK